MGLFSARKPAEINFELLRKFHDQARREQALWRGGVDLSSKEKVRAFTQERARIMALDVHEADLTDEEWFEMAGRMGSEGQGQAYVATERAKATIRKSEATQRNIARRQKEQQQTTAQAKLAIGAGAKGKRRGLGVGAAFADDEVTTRKRKTKGTGLAIGR